MACDGMYVVGSKVLLPLFILFVLDAGIVIFENTANGWTGMGVPDSAKSCDDGEEENRRNDCTTSSLTAVGSTSIEQQE